MKVWNELLEYINEYVYMPEEEEVVIRYSPLAGEAKAAYEKGLRVIGEDSHEKWMYDIALDCVRRMPPEDRDYVTKNLHTSEYHFGYAMGIRNKYIHSATKHVFYEADGVSSGIMRRIFSIVSPFYDFRNQRCVSFFDSHDVKRLMDIYGETHRELVEGFIQEVTQESTVSKSIDDRERFKERLREELGQEEFIRIFREAYLYYNENEKKNKREDWYWNVNFPGVKAILYPLETNQLNALRHLNYFWYVESGQAKNVSDCRKFIDEKLGLRERDAEFMARCFWEACSPYYNGTWKDLALRTTELDYGLQWRLEQQGIKTVGALIKKAEGELWNLPNITPEDVSEIKTALSKWLAKRDLDGCRERSNE